MCVEGSEGVGGWEWSLKLLAFLDYVALSGFTVNIFHFLKVLDQCLDEKYIVYYYLLTH